MPTRHLAAAAVLTLGTLSTGCFDTELYPTPSFRGEDVRLEMPEDGFRTLGERGEVMVLAHEVSSDVNRWVAQMAGDFGTVLDELAKHPPTREDGQWRIYGPFDGDDGEDAAWMARVAGDESEVKFEIFVGERGAKESGLSPVFSGSLAANDVNRSGNIAIDFDVIYQLDALREQLGDAEEFGGSISVEFSRDLKTSFKSVELAFDGFHYADGRTEDFDYRDETYAYSRDDDGAGSFHFATWTALEDEEWSGPELERLTVDMAWNDEQAGRARAQVLEGDLRYGDLVMHECFDAGYSLSWAKVAEPYGAGSGYDEGDPASCQLEESALDEG